MNTSKFMDKQIMDLSESSSSSPNDVFFIDLLNSQEEKHNKQTGTKKDLNENILPSYDFQPIRPLTTSQSLNHEGITQPGTRVSNSVDTKINSSVRSSRSMDVNESAKITSQVKDCKDFDARPLSEIDRAVTHADGLVHAIKGVSAQLKQIESRSRNLENLVLDIKVFVENTHGITEGKRRQMGSMVIEARRSFLDLAIHEHITGLKKLLDEKERKVKELENNLNAIIAKCRTLQVENEEIGQIAPEGKIHDLAMKLGLQKSQNVELKKEFDGLHKNMEGLLDDVGKSNELVLMLQESLEEGESEIRRLKEALFQTAGTEKVEEDDLAGEEKTMDWVDSV